MHERCVEDPVPIPVVVIPPDVDDSDGSILLMHTRDRNFHILSYRAGDVNAGCGFLHRPCRRAASMTGSQDWVRKEEGKKRRREMSMTENPLGRTECKRRKK